MLINLTIRVITYAPRCDVFVCYLSLQLWPVTFMHDVRNLPPVLEGFLPSLV